jgi:hypothetical protein
VDNAQLPTSNRKSGLPDDARRSDKEAKAANPASSELRRDKETRKRMTTMQLTAKPAARTTPPKESPHEEFDRQK